MSDQVLHAPPFPRWCLITLACHQQKILLGWLIQNPPLPWCVLLVVFYSLTPLPAPLLWIPTCPCYSWELSPVVYWVLFAAIAIASLSKICFYCCNCYSALVFFDASTNAFGLLEFCTTPLPLNNCRPVWGGKNQNKQNLGSTTLPPPVRARTKGGRSTGRYSIRRELHQKGKLWEQLHEF